MISASEHAAAEGDGRGQTASWFFENARELFGVVSAQGVFLEVNPAWTTLTGWSADELLGRQLLDFLRKDCREPVREMGRALNRDGDVPSRMCFRCKDGRWVWLEGYARRGAGGEMMGMLRDVTDDYRRAEALRQATQVQTLLSETAGVGLWRYDPRSETILWSAEWTRMLAEAGICMATPEDFARVCHPDDLDRVILAMEGAVEHGRAARFDHRMQAADGRWMHVRAHIRSEALGGGVHIVHGLSQDVTELVDARRASDVQNERLQLALSAARAAVVEVDYERRAVWTSPQLVELIGYSLSYEQAARPVWPCVVVDDAPTVRAAVRRWLGGEAPEPLEVRMRDAAGDARWVRVFTDIQRAADGRIVRTINLIKDTDERKRAELALVAAQRAAEAAAEAKSQFLANMSHELRTPMNGVLGILHLLKAQALSREAAPLVDEALSCGGMLQALLDDIVDFSRIEAGRLELACEPVDPQALVESVAAMMRRLADEKGLTLSLEIGALPPWVSTDPLRLRQCLFNLIGNAIKFTAEGGVRVRAVLMGEMARLRFEIEDTGVGIPNEVQSRLFERFQQADASTTRRFGGSGLGLAITRKLARMMGGDVGFVSELGKGSTFWLETPGQAVAPPEEAEPQGLSVLDGLRVLVVEDNATNRMIARRILEDLGAQVTTAEDGEEGVARAIASPIDLILMDVQMPRMDGVEATRRIRAAAGPTAQIPIIGLTANVMSHQRDDYLAAGMDGVVGKPVAPRVLLKEVLRIAHCEPAFDPPT